MSLSVALMGLLVGVLVGMTGVGGAALLTPVLLFIGIHPSIAIGTDLVYNSITKMVGTFHHIKQGTVNLKLVKYLSLGSIPGAIIAVGFLHFCKSIYFDQDVIIKQGVGIVLIFAAIGMIIKQFLHGGASLNRWQSKSIEKKQNLTMGIGLLLGFLVGLTSIGSGSLFAVAMMFFYKLTSSELVGTDIAHAFILVTVAGILHASFGGVDYLLVLNLLIGSIPGVIIGSNILTKFSIPHLRTLIGLMILFSGIKLLF